MSKRENESSVDGGSEVKRQALEEEEEDTEQQQQPQSEWMMLWNERDKWMTKLSTKMKDKTLSDKECAFFKKKMVEVDWKLEKLHYPADYMVLRGTRERLIHAELEYIRQTEKEDLSRKIDELEKEVSSAPESLKEAYFKDLISLFSRQEESENSWAERKIELRKQILKRIPLPWTCQGPMTWGEISEATSETPFVINTLLEDEASQRAVLGPLFKEGTTWPVVRTSTGLLIDMRFMPHRFFNPDGDVLRPAARHICNMISNSCNGNFFPLGVPGSGKSSALVDVGREHFVIFIRAIPRIDLTDEIDYGIDRNFVRMYLDLCERISLENNRIVMGENDRILQHRAEVELMARILQLVRLYREIGTTLTPWMFTVHQLACSDQDFVKEMVCCLGNSDSRSLQKVLYEAMKELAPLLNVGPKLVIAINDTEFSMELLKERFRPPSDPVSEFRPSLVSGIGLAANLLFEKLFEDYPYFVIFAGAGLLVKNVARGSMVTYTGRLLDDRTLTGHSVFPVCRKEDIVRIFSCLNISEELRNLVENMSASQWPLHLPHRKGSTRASIKYLLEDYVVDARLGLLCGVIEFIKECLDEDAGVDESSVDAKLEDQSGKEPNPTNSNNCKTADELLLRSIEKILEAYREYISWCSHNLIHSCKFDEKETDDYLRYLLSVAVAMKLTNGKAKIVREKNVATLQWIDLIRQGIALDVEEHSERLTKLLSFTCHERIAVEAIELLFSESEQVLNSPEIASYRRTLDLLSTFLDGFAKEEPIFKGSPMDSIVFSRLIALQRDCPTVGDLPFLPQNLDPSWKSIPFNPREIKQADELLLSSTSTPDFLISQAAENVIYVPERNCRPDGIIMLPRTEGLSRRRAVSFGIALHSYQIPQRDAKHQNFSTDLFRSYLKRFQGIHPAIEQMRQKWVENGLHDTLTIRVLIQLPRVSGGNAIVHEHETKVEGGSSCNALQTFDVDDDVVVRLDCSNIHLLLGPMDETNHMLYELLKIATDVIDGWCVRNDICSNLTN